MPLLFLLFSLFLLPSLLRAQEEPKPVAKKEYKNNIASDSSLFPYEYKSRARYKGYKKESMYLPMRDGILIAIDLYLPKGMRKGDKLPTLIRQTRYWRSPNLRFPFSLFSKGLIGRMGKMMQEVIEQGYAIVNVDVRGSGASFGVQPHPWTEDEIQDGNEILNWIIEQDWSNGKVGAIGVSYDGTAAEFLASKGHPALKAAVVMYSLFDVYEDNAFPGGVHNCWFTYNWGLANEQMDRNELPPNAQKYKHLIKGVSKVKGPGSKHVLKQAIRAHRYNRNVHDGAMTVECRDDIPTDTFIRSVDAFSPHNSIDALRESGVAIYSYSGWFDGAYQLAAIKRHCELGGSKHKLILGPWEHGGQFNCSPWTYSKAGFDHLGEILKFFDYHLKGIENGLYEEPAVQYFSMGAEQWRHAPTWPPPSAKHIDWYLDGQRLSQSPCTTHSEQQFLVDNQWGSGDKTRWKAVNGKVQDPFAYSDWTERSQGLLHYLSEPLQGDMELAGHASLKLRVSSDNCDGALFAYIEDVAPDGQVRQVTEGLLRLSHRQFSEREACPVPLHSHWRKDEQPLQAGEFVEIELHLLPTAYRFKAGHRLRLSISGGDNSHFEAVIPQGYTLKVEQLPEQAPRLRLPIIEAEQ